MEDKEKRRSGGGDKGIEVGEEKERSRRRGEENERWRKRGERGGGEQERR